MYLLLVTQLLADLLHHSCPIHSVPPGNVASPLSSLLQLSRSSHESSELLDPVDVSQAFSL